MTNPGEAALATIGISNVLKGTVEKVGIGKLREINDIDSRIQALAKQLVENTLPEPKMPRVHNYRATLDRLSRKLSPAELQELGERFHEDGAQHMSEFLIVLQQCYHQLRAIFPTSDFQTFAGPVQLVPDTDRVWTFFSQLLVLNDPLSVFELIGSAALLQSQVRVLRQFFPSLSQSVDDAIYAAVQNAKVEKLSYRLPARAETGVAVWRSQRTIEHQATPKPKIIPLPKKPPSYRLQTNLETQGQAADFSNRQPRNQ